MPYVTAHFTVSLDGFMAGPDQTLEQPLGVGGEDLHRWMFDEAEHPADVAVRERILAPRGAYIMGRNMFGPVRGEWGDADWRGWWGDEPPYHAPVFVLTHHPRESVEMEGGTTFHFVGSFDEALERALGRRPATRRSPSRAARARSDRGSRQAWSTSSWCRTRPWPSAAGSGRSRPGRSGPSAGRGARVAVRDARGLPDQQDLAERPGHVPDEVGVAHQVRPAVEVEHAPPMTTATRWLTPSPCRSRC